MPKDRRPVPEAPAGSPHGAGGEDRQPYASEHEDYSDGVAKPPEEQGGAQPPRSKKTSPRRR